MQISLAPIQGITGAPFRRLFQKSFGGVEKYYTPYIRLDQSRLIPKKYQKDLDPIKNEGLNLIPQVMSNNADELLFLSEYIAGLGYTEMNWNLGCPYPMVTKRKLGSGMLPYPELVQNLLDTIMPELSIGLSIKLRLGLESVEEIEKLIPVLNNYSIKEVILHPRIGKDLYKGAADLDAFDKIKSLFKVPLAYNGDIDSPGFFLDLTGRFSEISHFMIGRGLIMNPFLAEDIAGINVSNQSRTERFSKFHDLLFENFCESLSGPSHQISRMHTYWQYFALSFSNSPKVFKLIKKATSIPKYESAVSKILQEEEWIA